MQKTDWDIQKIKRLKWRQLVQYNIVMLLSFIPWIYYVQAGVSVYLFFHLLCLLMWIIVGYMLYILKTGKIIGTKTIKLVFAFDKGYLGERRWKRRKMIELIVLIIFTIVITVLVLTIDFIDRHLEIYNLFPFIGAWLGGNIGEILRINKL